MVDTAFSVRMVYEWVNVRQCKALWIKALYQCNPFTIYQVLVCSDLFHTETNHKCFHKDYSEVTVRYSDINGFIKTSESTVECVCLVAGLSSLTWPWLIWLRLGGAAYLWCFA